MSQDDEEDAGGASGKVFAIPELLEMILLDLDIEDILVKAQRVNKIWRLIIQNSPKLQQALFFQPLPSLDTMELPLPSLHQEPLYSWPISNNERKKVIAITKPFYKQHALRNPLCRHFEKLEIKSPGGARVWFHGTDVHRRPGASWRRMLLSQPPLEILRGETRIVRLGDLVNACNAAIWWDWSHWWTAPQYGRRYTAREILRSSS